MGLPEPSVIEAHLHEWLNLVVRWIHMITGIAWIGASFYFNWVEGQLNRKGPNPPGIAGDLWAVHGGGFYHSQKYQVAPERLPEKLHWFKWEAYMTWVSGMALLIIVYFWQAESYMVDPSVADLSGWQAIAINLSAMLLGWLIYDQLCRSPFGQHNDWMLYLFIIALPIVAWGLGQFLSGRATYITVGGMIGSMMVGNVFFVIIPVQKKMVGAMLAGETPDGKMGKQGLQRSRHNNYLTLPVLLIMISNHFPTTFGHSYHWLILGALSVIGIVVKHYFNLRHQGNPPNWLLPSAGLATVAVLILSGPWMRETTLTAQMVSDNQAISIVQRRCTSCHAAMPTQPGFTAPPKGVILETVAHLRQYAAQVQAQAVTSNIMPLANLTGMTQDERNQLGGWLQQNL